MHTDDGNSTEATGNTNAHDNLVDLVRAIEGMLEAAFRDADIRAVRPEAPGDTAAVSVGRNTYKFGAGQHDEDSSQWIWVQTPMSRRFYVPFESQDSALAFAIGVIATDRACLAYALCCGDGFAHNEMAERLTRECVGTSVEYFPNWDAMEE